MTKVLDPPNGQMWTAEEMKRVILRMADTLHGADSFADFYHGLYNMLLQSYLKGIQTNQPLTAMHPIIAVMLSTLCMLEDSRGKYKDVDELVDDLHDHLDKHHAWVALMKVGHMPSFKEMWQHVMRNQGGEQP